jgi:formylglycine-generating enzyme required for sulfatase activity
MLLIVVVCFSSAARAQVFVLQGEKGDGLECSDDACAVSGNRHLQVNGDVVIAGSIEGDAGIFSSVTADAWTVGVTLLDRDCPDGYIRSTEEGDVTVCVKAIGGDLVDEMVRVGDFWIDRYEMSVWDTPACAGTQYGADGDDWPLPQNGDWTGLGDAYGCSVPMVPPTRFMTWFQAMQSCRASGKSLCTNAEWQVAALGTPDPEAPTPLSDVEPCNIHDGVLPLGGLWASEPQTTLTGSAAECISGAGAYDMVGNVAEWVSDWMAGGRTWLTQDIVGLIVWPSSYHTDIVWNLNGSAHNGAGFYMNGMPAAALRGGTWSQGEEAGVYSFSLEYGPSFAGEMIGARCCIR